MRRTYTFLACMLLGLFTLSCGNSESGPTPEEILIGSWRLQKFDMKGQQVPLQIMATSSFNFSPDGTYEIVLGELERGTWTLGKNKKVLITIKEGTTQEQHIDIEKLTEEETVLVNNTGPNPVRMTIVPDI